LAVSLHQSDAASSDLSFDLEVNGETSTACTASGTILREYWANVGGTAVSAIPVNTTPTSTMQLTSFEAPSGAGDNYGQRIRGYICAPATGNYTFYIAGDDDCELYLSSSDSPASKQKIASFTGWTNNREWAKYLSQKSAIISLQANKKYYIEALHKEATGGDHLAVAWQTPANNAITIIGGNFLSPVITTSASLANGREDAQKTALIVYPNPFEDKVTIATDGVRGKVLVSLLDAVGKQYYQKEYQIAPEQRELDVDLSAVNLRAGLYLIKLQTDDGQSRMIKVFKK
jgi:hypothetical protein